MRLSGPRLWRCFCSLLWFRGAAVTGDLVGRKAFLGNTYRMKGTTWSAPKTAPSAPSPFRQGFHQRRGHGDHPFRTGAFTGASGRGNGPQKPGKQRPGGGFGGRGSNGSAGGRTAPGAFHRPCQCGKRQSPCPERGIEYAQLNEAVASYISASASAVFSPNANTQAEANQGGAPDDAEKQRLIGWRMS